MAKIVTTGVVTYSASIEIRVQIVNLDPDDDREVTVSVLNWTASCPGTELAKTAEICGALIPGGPFTAPLEVELGPNQRLEVKVPALRPTVTHFEVRVELEKDKNMVVNSQQVSHNTNFPHPTEGALHFRHTEFVRIDVD